MQTEAMARVSHDKLVSKQPLRRPFLITRSGNVGTFKYAASTWSGDNVSAPSQSSSLVKEFVGIDGHNPNLVDATLCNVGWYCAEKKTLTSFRSDDRLLEHCGDDEFGAESEESMVALAVAGNIPVQWNCVRMPGL